MKDLFIRDLPREGQFPLFAVATAKEVKEKKNGDPYLSITLADKTGFLDAKLWDDVDSIGPLFKINDVVKVLGDVGEYRGKTQFTIKKLRLALPEEVERGDYVPCSDRDPQEMLGEVVACVTAISDPFIKQVVANILSDPQVADTLLNSPAAKGIHHDFSAGLLEHICSLLSLGDKICDHYPHLDRDLIKTACILHDIGKCVELKMDMSISYTTEGQLLGHVAIGYALLCKHCDAIQDFPSPIRLKLGHLILSHHGKLEWGALKIPGLPEAMVFHEMDVIDARIEQFKKAISNPVDVDDDFSPYIHSLGTAVFRK